MSAREQEPGPRGSPQDAQGLAEGAEGDDPLAKTEIWGSSLVAWHFGHSAFSLP